MRRYGTVAALAGALMVAGCNPAGGGNTTVAGNEAADMASAADAIRAEEAQWQRDYAARNVEALVGHYSADATMVEPGVAPHVGSAAIREADAHMVADPGFSLTFGNDRIQVARSGDFAYSRGHFTLHYTDPTAHRPAQMDGAYLTVWQKQADGRWQAVEDFITPGPAAAPAAATPAAQ